MSNWVLQYKSADFIKIGKRFSIDPSVARVIRNRDVVSEEEIQKYLCSTKLDMYDPFLLKDMDLCVTILQEQIRMKNKIRIIGDYDIDGICASYILYIGILQAGGIVDIAIPDRIKDGYGLNERLIIEANKDGIQTIITCDNGIAAADSVELAKQKNMKILVTDHHEIPFRITNQGKECILPNADAVVNPKQSDCRYPFKEICGALVAYKVVDALFTKLQEDKKSLDELLGFAAFATIGDVMNLVDENRIVVKDGLSIIAQTKNIGLKALMKACQLEGKKLSPYHIGFILGPCINATGRLDSAFRAIELFLSTDEEEAYSFAMKLKDLNEERKKITMEGVEQAITYVENETLKEDKILVIYLTDCHESIAGIIAGRIREKYQKPTFVLTKTETGVKGSGRSIAAYHMYEKMCICKDILIKFGGHKAAAGLSIAEENIGTFRKKLNDNCDLSEKDLQETKKIDLELPLSYVNMNLIKQFEYLEPFGVGNRKPLFAQRKVKFIKGKRVGNNGRVRKFIVEDQTGFRTELISFKEEDSFVSQMDEVFGKGTLELLYTGQARDMEGNILFYPSINEYMGKESVQFILDDFKSI